MKSIADDPKQWDVPQDVRDRERDTREGIMRYRVMQAEDRARAQGITRSILTPEPDATQTGGFSEYMALAHAVDSVVLADGGVAIWDAEAGEYFLAPPNRTPAPQGGQDDDPGS